MENTVTYPTKERRVAPSIPGYYSAPVPVRRVSWAAVFAGVVVAMTAQMFFSTVGLAVGASAINPLQEANPFAVVGIGAGIWFAVSAIISLYLGGWVAGRMSNIARLADCMLHGLLTWGLSSLLAALLVTSAVGGILSGTMSLLGKGISSAGQGATAGTAGGGADMGSIRREARDLVQGARQQAQNVAPKAEAQARQTGETAARGVGQAALWTSILMFLGALAAAFGGFQGGKVRDELKPISAG